MNKNLRISESTLIILTGASFLKTAFSLDMIINQKAKLKELNDAYNNLSLKNTWLLFVLSKLKVKLSQLQLNYHLGKLRSFQTSNVSQ